MYHNIGKKIKGYAVFVAVLGMIGSIIGGFTLIIMAINYEAIGLLLLGVLVAVLGSVLAWMSTWLLYGYGELIDKTALIEKKLDNINAGQYSYAFRNQQPQPNPTAYARPQAQPHPQTPVYQQPPIYQQQPVYTQPPVQPPVQTPVQPPVQTPVQPQPPVMPGAEPKTEPNPIAQSGDNGYNNILPQ